jgi:hypothetical protein
VGTAVPNPTRESWWERKPDSPPDEIDRAAAIYRIPAELVRAVIWAESAGDAAVVSPNGKIGLMGLTQKIAGEMYVEDPVDPAQNILGGTRYLRWLANQFNGDMLLTLAAYNAGPDAVKKYGGVPPFEETRQYVRRVMAYYLQLKGEQGVAATPNPAPSSKTRQLVSPPAPPDRIAADFPSGFSHGYACTGDCSGHNAGYNWAEKHDIQDGDACDEAGEHSNSPSFAEGCHAYIDGDSSQSEGSESPSEDAE